MSSDLTIIQPAQLAEGGVGIDFGSRLFAPKPATISINQPTTQAEGAIRGKLRIVETGQQFDKMTLTLLEMPKQQRAWNVGEQGSRTADSLMCFSRDSKTPDSRARMPQAISCFNCERSSWDAYRAEKERQQNAGISDPIALRALIPPCDTYWYALFIDTVFKMPLQMYIRSKSKEPFEKGMESVGRLLYLLKAQGKNPNLWDVQFDLSTTAIKGKTTTYVPSISGVRVVEDQDRAAFGDVYLRHVNRFRQEQQAQQEARKSAAIQTEQDYIEGEILSDDDAIPF